MSIFTDEQKRVIRENAPALSDRPPGMDLPKVLEEHDDKTTSGFATILSGQVAIVVAVGSAFDGKPVQASFAEAPTVAATIFGVVSGGNLTLTIQANNTADLLCAYSIDGR